MQRHGVMLGRVGGIHDAVLVCVLLFVADLFLDWHRTGVNVVGVMRMHMGSSGWEGWGGVAGVFALALAAVELARGRGLPRWLAPALALGMVAATIAIAGGTHASAGAVAIGTGAARWPAWAGLVLATLAAAAAVLAFIAEPEQETLASPNHTQGAAP